MSDDTRPPLPDDLGALLRGFADDVEPLIDGPTLPGVRARARQRTVRRRVASVGIVCTAILATSLWGLPALLNDARPLTPVGPGLVSAASILPPPRGTDSALPRKDLLSAFALPWNSTYQWHITATGDGSGNLLPRGWSDACGLPSFAGTEVESQIARTYAGHGAASAQHRIAAFADDTTAAGVVAESVDMLRACGWHETGSPERTRHPPAPEVYEFLLTADHGAPLRVTLVQTDRRVAVLAIATKVASDHAHADPRTDRCMGKTMDSDGLAHTPSAASAGHC